MVTVFDKTNPSKHLSGTVCSIFPSGGGDALASGFSNNGGKARLTFAEVTPVDVIVDCAGAEAPTPLTLQKKMTRVTVFA